MEGDSSKIDTTRPVQPASPMGPNPFPQFDLSKNSPPNTRLIIIPFTFEDMISPHLKGVPAIPGDTPVHLNNNEEPLSRKAKHAREHSQRRLFRKIQAGRKHGATWVATSLGIHNLPKTSTEWMGKDMRYKPDQQWLEDSWIHRQILSKMIEMGFRSVAYEGCPTWFVDKDGIVFGFRTDQPLWMMSSDFKDNKSLLEAITQACRDYIKACGDIPQGDVNDNHRGNHWFMVIGVDRQCSDKPKYTAFHLNHLSQTKELMDNVAIQRLIGWAKSVFTLNFPVLAARVLACQAKLEAMGYPPHIAQPQYGLWYNFCINGPRGEVKGVSTQPHADAKNLAIMMCVVFVYGKFNSKEKAWLVLWEAGLYIEIPIGVLMYYPSALFTHFNVDMTDLKIVTTPDGTVPTQKTADPLHGVEGRGSIVLFNQASLFQLAELGQTVKQTKKEGRSAICDNDPYICQMPVVQLD